MTKKWRKQVDWCCVRREEETGISVQPVELQSPSRAAQKAKG